MGRENLMNRVNWIYEQVEKIPGGKRILDAGAGQLLMKPYCNHLKYVSQDLAQYDGVGDGKGEQGRWRFKDIDIISDITDIPEPDESFDAILCAEVFEHIPDPIAALKEFNRLLIPGGRMLITVPFCCLNHQSPFFFYTGFSENFFIKYLEGYEVTIYHNGNRYSWMAQELRRLQKEGKLSRHEQLFDELFRAYEKDKKGYELLCFGLFVLAIKDAKDKATKETEG